MGTCPEVRAGAGDWGVAVMGPGESSRSCPWGPQDRAGQDMQVAVVLGPHSSPLPLPFPTGILWLSLAWGQHRGCDTTGGGKKRLSSTCQGKGSTSEHSSQQNSPSCCRAERSPTLRAAPTRTASPGTRTRLAMVSQEGCVGRAAQPPCCWQDKSCWDLQCQAPVSTGQRTGRCVPQAGGTGKSCEVLAWCPVDGGSIR